MIKSKFIKPDDIVCLKPEFLKQFAPKIKIHSQLLEKRTFTSSEFKEYFINRDETLIHIELEESNFDYDFIRKYFYENSNSASNTLSEEFDFIFDYETAPSFDQVRELKLPHSNLEVTFFDNKIFMNILIENSKLK